MDTFIKVCAVSVVCVCVYMMLINGTSSSVALTVKFAGAILVGVGTVIIAEPVVGEMLSIADIKGNVGEYAGVVIKATGIAVLSHICADICRDTGNLSLASGVTFAAKLEIVILCIPVMRKIIGNASEIMNMR